MAQFKFVGSTRSATKISWPVRAKALVIKAHKIDGLAGAKAFEAGIAAFNASVPETEQITSLPKSYTNKNAGSVLYGIEQRFLERCEKGDEATITVARELGLIESHA